MKRHAWAAIRQSHKLEETMDRVETKCEYSYCYIHAWIARCIELLDINKSNVLRYSFVSVDA